MCLMLLCTVWVVVRAKARQIAQIINADIQPLGNLRVLTRYHCAFTLSASIASHSSVMLDV